MMAAWLAQTLVAMMVSVQVRQSRGKLPRQAVQQKNMTFSPHPLVTDRGQGQTEELNLRVSSVRRIAH